jgi:hypothetical protein
MRDIITIYRIIKSYEAITLHIYRYITIHSVNFVSSLPLENLENIECEIMKRYNGWIIIITVY